MGRLVRHVVEVVDVTDLTPWYRRVTFAGRGLLARLDLAPAAPLVIHCPGPVGPVERSYTLALPDVAADRFALDFVLHDPSGPASAWAQRARPGVLVEVTDPPYHLVRPEPLWGSAGRHDVAREEPRGGRSPAPDCCAPMSETNTAGSDRISSRPTPFGQNSVLPHAPKAVLIGDTSAAAALESLRRGLPVGVASTVVLVDPHPDLERVPPSGEVVRLPRLTDNDLAAIDLDPEVDWLWAAGERNLVKRLRAHARDHWRLPRSRQHLQTYWIARS